MTYRPGKHIITTGPGPAWCDHKGMVVEDLGPDGLRVLLFDQSNGKDGILLFNRDNIKPDVTGQIEEKAAAWVVHDENAPKTTEPPYNVIDLIIHFAIVLAVVGIIIMVVIGIVGS